jgi:hypothetical protein
LRGDLQEQESIGLYFQLGAVFFFFFVSFLYKKNSQNSTQKKRKKSEISIGRTNYKILPISVSKDSEISQKRKEKHWLGAVLFCFLNFII